MYKPCVCVLCMTANLLNDSRLQRSVFMVKFKLYLVLSTSVIRDCRLFDVHRTCYLLTDRFRDIVLFISAL